MNDKKKLAIDMKNSIYVDKKDCRNIIIQCDSLSDSIIAVDILKEALDVYAKLPVERLDRFIGAENDR